MGPVGDFLETRLCKIARQLMDGETLPDPPERSKGGIPPDFRQPGKKGCDLLMHFSVVTLKKKRPVFFLFEMIFLILLEI